MSNGKYQKPLVGGEVRRAGGRNASTSGGGGSACPTARLRPVGRLEGPERGRGPGPDAPLRDRGGLAAAIYVLLSCGRRVETSEQALAVVEKVYLSGDAAREIGEHMARENAGAATAEGVEPWHRPRAARDTSWTPSTRRKGLEFGTTMAFSPGAHLAASRTRTTRSNRQVRGYQRPRRTPMLRKRGDRERTLQIQIGSVCREFNAKLATASPGEILTAAHCAVEAAIEADREVLEPYMRPGPERAGRRRPRRCCSPTTRPTAPTGRGT